LVLGIIGSLWVVLWIIISFFIGGVAIMALFAAFLGMQQIGANLEMAEINQAIVEFRDNNGVLPADLSTLPNLEQEDLIDAWGNPYRYERTDSGQFTLSSDGEDGVQGTADDIVFDPDDWSFLQEIDQQNQP
ncbi:MAG: type II secretion system protein GspG, partial [Planctomycetota bacterium]|nr:type II secretion system protein GspG [Planctomycetota bacterium]